MKQFWGKTEMNKHGDGWSKEAFEQTQCYKDLKERGYIAVSIYTQSWGGTPGDYGWDGKQIDHGFFTKEE